jgi:Flp pilus assembly protein TadD
LGLRFRAHSNLGVILVRRGQYVEALAKLDVAVSLDATSEEAHMNRGVALVNVDRRQEAILSLRRAVELAPGYTNAHKNLATLYFQAGMVDSAQYFHSLAR